MGVAPLCERRDSAKVWGDNDVISWSTSDIAGIHLGDSHITAARVVKKGEGPLVITHAGWVPYDVSAPEKDIAGMVKNLWRAIHMPTNMVCASLRSSAMVMRYFKMPSMTAAELKSALTLQAEEAMQLTRDKLSVDWHIQKPMRGNTVPGFLRVEGVLAAAPIKDVSRQLAILAMAGLDAVIVDVRAMAVANLYQVLDNSGGESSVCLVNMSPHSADVIVMRKMGGVYPYTVFCRASTWEQSPGFLAENIRDVLKYSEFKLDWDSVRRILLTGEVPGQAEFIDHLRADLKLPVEMWDPLAAMTVRGQRMTDRLAESPANASLLVPSLGLAIRRS
jgi:Tfp pilus assembly PilM family ATPase